MRYFGLGQLNQVDDIVSSEPIDIASKIETLEDQFDDLQTRIIDELSTKPGITVQNLLSKLTRLPLSLREEYQSSIAERISSMSTETHINKLFIVHLNPLTSFIDYGLIEHVVKKFCGDNLRKDMQSYCCDVQTFMKQTTIQQLIDFWPGKQQAPEKFEVLKAKIGKNASTCTLDEINALRRRFCAELQLSEVVFCLIALEESNSFIISWLVPSVLVPDLIESARKVKESLFDEINILSLRIGNQWLYNHKLTLFGAKLRERYQQSQGSPSPVEWIPSPTKKIFRLAMIQRERVQRGHIEDVFVRMTISGRVDDILHAKSPVELENIFTNILYGGEIILIEGAPGSGKSTLSVHICQKWGKGELFQPFTVVILVQLRDPAVRRAQTIADLLPAENAQEIAAELIATNGSGLLWVFDGWDELPPHLQQDSIFRKLLPAKPSAEKLAELKQDRVYSEDVGSGYNKPELPNQYYKDRLLGESSVVVTSRPISSGDLHPVVSSRIEVLGFTPEELRQYFTECLKGDTKALEILLEKIQENPVVQSICYLPLNAAFIVHTFKYKDQSLPNTEYEIYLSVILSCIQRHYEREGRGHGLPRELASLSRSKAMSGGHGLPRKLASLDDLSLSKAMSRDRDLPRELASLYDLSWSKAVREPFQCLCELAYHGVMENKVTFSSSDLPQGSNTLSLLQAIESFLRVGKSMFYNFLHLSIQEILSAYYIATWLSGSEQVSQFQKLFNQPRFAPVFQFYAAFTKLKNPGIRQIIAKIIESESKQSIYEPLGKPLLVSLLRCLHEAQDPSLCHYVAGQLVKRFNVLAKMQYVRLDLSSTLLSPLDCLSVSFFLSSADMAIEVDLDKCSIGDLGAKCLTKYLDSDLDHVNVSLLVRNNDIHEEGASHIARTVDFIEHLYLSNNPIGDTGVSAISKAVSVTATLKTLILFHCGITSRGTEDLSRALALNCSLEKLDIGRNSLRDEGIIHMAEALKQNKHLKELWIGENRITDKGAASLASALSINNSLKMLHMGGSKGALTEDGLSTITQSLANNSELVELAIPADFHYIVGCLRQKVNEARKSNGLTPIGIIGEFLYNYMLYGDVNPVHDSLINFTVCLHMCTATNMAFVGGPCQY